QHQQADLLASRKRGEAWFKSVHNNKVCLSEIENGTPSGADQVFQPKPERERKIYPEPKSGSDKRNVNEEQPHATGSHPQPIGESRRHVEAVLFEKIFDVQHQ